MTGTVLKVRLLPRLNRAITAYHQRVGRTAIITHLVVYSGGADQGRRELVLRKAGHEARFPHAGVSKEQDANRVVKVVPLMKRQGFEIRTTDTL